MNFINEYFDGVSLEIPFGCISLNPELKERLDDLRKTLENLQFMGQHPRIGRSLYELENFEQKKAMIKEQEDRQRNCREEQEKRNKLLLERKLIPIVFDEMKSTSSNSPDLTIDGVVFENVLTSKEYLKAEVKKHFNSIKSKFTKESFIEFARSNQMYLEPDAIIPEFFDPNKVELVANAWGGVLVKFPIIRGQVYERGKRDKDKMYFRSPVIEKNEKGFYIGLIVNELEKGENGRYYFTNYTLEKNQFIRN